MSNKTKSIIQMLICATLWSIAGIFMKWLPWNGFAIASLRSLIASLTFAIYMVFAKKSFIFNWKTILGGILTGCVYICFACANKLTTAANAIVLQFTAPVFVVILNAIFLKTKVLKKDVITVIITLFGITLFFIDKLEPGYIKGNIIAIFSGLFMAGMFIIVGSVDEDERFSTVFIGQFFAFIVGLPFVIKTHPLFNCSTVACILILGIFQLGIAYILYVKSSKYCPPLACCLLGGLEPLLNPVWVMLFDGEKPGIFALIGGIIVVVIITIWCAVGAKEDA